MMSQTKLPTQKLFLIPQVSTVTRYEKNIVSELVSRDFKENKISELLTRKIKNN